MFYYEAFSMCPKEALKCMSVVLHMFDFFKEKFNKAIQAFLWIDNITKG